MSGFGPLAWSLRFLDAGQVKTKHSLLWLSRAVVGLLRRAWSSRAGAVITASVVVFVFGHGTIAVAQCGPGNGDCCSANNTAGCEDEVCCAAVCAIDNFCCAVDWDNVCAAEAQNLCGICGATPNCPAEGSCFEPHPNPGCEDAACCETVCAFDPDCC